MFIKEGCILKAKVTGIQSYGAFVKINNNLNGLIHISEISDDYVRNIAEYVHVGDVLNVYVLSIENNQAYLSLKRVETAKNSFKDNICSKFNERDGFKQLEEQLPIWIKKQMKTSK